MISKKTLLKFEILLIVFVFYYNNIFPLFEIEGILGYGAEPSGMGGAYCAKADSPFSIFYNPAGLYQYKNTSLFSEFASIANIKNNNFITGVVINFQPYFSYSLAGYGLFNTENNFYESFLLSAVSVSFLDNESVSFLAGLNLKFLYAHYINYASTVGADMGFLYRLKNLLYSKSINLGIFFKDIQTKIRWSNGMEEQLPFLIKIGVAYIGKEDFSLTTDMDIINYKIYTNNYRILFRYGIEKNFDFLVNKSCKIRGNIAILSPAFKIG